MKRSEPRRSAFIESAVSMLSFGSRKRQDPVADAFAPEPPEARRSLLDLLSVPDSVCWPGPMRAHDPGSWADYHRAMFEQEFAHGVVARIFGLSPDGRRLVARRARSMVSFPSGRVPDRGGLLEPRAAHSPRSR
jgi:hypothetical protein